MRIEHVAIWTENLESMKDFYLKYFEVRAGHKYINPKKNFQSYFLTFDSGARLELMTMPGIGRRQADYPEFMGFTHIAISLGSKEKVTALTEQLRQDGWIIAGEPRTTGDGYYESVILDPEGNRLELTV
jgi:lactoylglutathione lyase